MSRRTLQQRTRATALLDLYLDDEAAYPPERVTREEPLDRSGTCQVDGIALGEHERCRACEILAGPAHVTLRLRANGLCAACAAREAQELSLAA